ncbi:putative signal transducing protein [Chloroflexota bacterium]
MEKIESDFVVIQTVQGELTAQVMKTHLESEGIPVLLQRESLGTVYGLTTDGLGAVKILVPQEFAKEAKQILKGDTSSEPA